MFFQNIFLLLLMTYTMAAAEKISYYCYFNFKVDITIVPLIFLISYSLVTRIEIYFKYFLDTNPKKQPQCLFQKYDLGKGLTLLRVTINNYFLFFIFPRFQYKKRCRNLHFSDQSLRLALQFLTNIHYSKCSNFEHLFWFTFILQFQ